MCSSTSNTLLIRADAGPRMGSSVHVQRCLALAQGHRIRGGQVRLRTRLTVDSPLAKRYLAAGAEIEEVEEEPGSDADRDATLACLETLGSRHIVIDGRHFDSSFQSHLCDAGCAVLWIDDEAHASPYRAAWILNQNLHACAELYGRRHADSHLLLGPRYALLGQEFLRWRRTLRTTPTTARRILVTLGEGDNRTATQKIVEGLRLLRREGTELEVDVVVGEPPEAHLDIPREDGFECLHGVDDLAPLMARADMAITTDGHISWELAAMGLPALIGTLAARPSAQADLLDTQGSAGFLGSFEDLSVDRIADAVADLLHDASRRVACTRAGRRLVDGRGVERVLDVLWASPESPRPRPTIHPQETSPIAE